MKSLKALTEHLRSLQLINDDAFDSWVEKGVLEYAGSTVTAGFTAPVSQSLRINYLAVLSWEAWHGSAEALFHAVMKWLVERDYDFDQHGFPVFSAVVLDDDVVDLQIDIKFEDIVYESEGVPVAEPTPSVVTAFVMECGQ